MSAEHKLVVEAGRTEKHYWANFWRYNKELLEFLHAAGCREITEKTRAQNGLSYISWGPKNLFCHSKGVGGYRVRLQL